MGYASTDLKALRLLTFQPAEVQFFHPGYRTLGRKALRHPTDSITFSAKTPRRLQHSYLLGLALAAVRPQLLTPASSLSTMPTQQMGVEIVLTPAATKALFRRPPPLTKTLPLRASIKRPVPKNCVFSYLNPRPLFLPPKIRKIDTTFYPRFFVDSGIPSEPVCCRFRHQCTPGFRPHEACRAHRK